MPPPPPPKEGPKGMPLLWGWKAKGEEESGTLNPWACYPEVATFCAKRPKPSTYSDLVLCRWT